MTTVSPMIRVMAVVCTWLASSLCLQLKAEMPSPSYVMMEAALRKYYEIEKDGGWTEIKAARKFYMQGQTAPEIVSLKKRLKATGDYDSKDLSPEFTAELAQAVRKVQKRFGHKENGVVDKLLLKELNVPIEKRIRQLEVNLSRLRQQPATTGTKLVANIPEFKLHVYEGDQHVFDMDIVVGSQNNKTVIFNDEMKQIVFSPYWNVPPSIVEEEILPAMRKSSTYLRRNGYEQVGTENGLPVIRQKPGPKNSLGLVKFVFPNSHNIYFHDTPAKSLFQIRKRTFSHGCIRLAEPGKLAAYLLRNRPEWNESSIEKAMNSGCEQAVALKDPVAVSITYYTAWVDKEGLVHFREDVYGLDD